jgi:hypothetical protein
MGMEWNSLLTRLALYLYIPVAGEKGATYADSFVVEKGNYNLMKIFQDQAGVPPEITPFTFSIDADSL